MRGGNRGTGSLFALEMIRFTIFMTVVSILDNNTPLKKAPAVIQQVL
ncbi:hypothetical protein DSOL_1343 [Desulfosporosinus metallidurans]|uniref:Uncharacterized protein n=1 Tax=Desulfosporosinus metallidurans TaxID=1888891 RepID=A0A1Q8QZY0_9FIRM|nr:hypothetical protein DSOL_1343 [Desulfosporosinus metallidurans]